MKTVVINYNAGNTQSLIFALNRLGIEPLLTADREEITTADKVFLPGVGHAAAAMQELKKAGLDQLITALENPLLGICLGQQLLCRFSEEGATSCLGVFDLDVLRFGEELKVPHMGWNTVSELKSDLFHKIPEETFFYHVHSYYVPESEYSIANCDYQVNFAAAIRKDNFYGVQFHPEKSGTAGSKLLENFLNL